MKRSLVLSVLLAVLAPAAPSGAVLPIPLVRLTPVAAFASPLAMSVRTGDSALYVVEQRGRIMAVRDGVVDPVPVLDITPELSTGSEQGLLGLAFSPDGSHMYIDYTDTAGDTHLTVFDFADGRPVLGTRRDLLVVDQPFANHNGGTLAFGPDGYLYFGLGDGGSAGDPFNNGQNLNSHLGKMLRINPTPDGPQPYTVPASNPFVGVPGVKPEIWAWGLRNPWKWSFDRLTGDLYIADVGQNIWEEVNWQPASSSGGENYGWDRLEGRHPFSGPEPTEHVLPIHEYDHAQGRCSITGGYVYRGTKIPALTGAYLFGDFCNPRLHFLRHLNGTAVQVADLGAAVPALSGFGEDHDGNLYAISLGGGLFRIDPLIPGL